MEQGADYGVLHQRNIGRVVFGDYVFDTWYGNGAYFHPGSTEMLGYKYWEDVRNKTPRQKNGKVVKVSGKTPKRHENGRVGRLGRGRGKLLGNGGPKDPKHPSTPVLKPDLKPKSDPKTPKSSSTNNSFWLETLYVCELCFKHTEDHDEMSAHRPQCTLNTVFPTIGTTMYLDTTTPYIIKRVRGFEHQMFCQQLCLFGKLFLDDKSVYYNIDSFDFYVVYGNSKVYGKKYIPMGFFSKETIAWDGDNNLACICVFPPFQRLHIGSLLVEFSYALAKFSPGQAISGPELPLSPYGKLTYLRFWSRKLATTLVRFEPESRRSLTLASIARNTGFRPEDILLTLEFMKVLTMEKTTVRLQWGNLLEWCRDHKIDPWHDKSMLNPECLII